MPAWFEQFTSDVKDLNNKAAKKTSNASLEGLENSLIKRVLAGSFGEALRALKQMNPFFSRREQGRLVIMKALSMPGADHKTVESVIDFVCKARLLPKQTIFEILFTGAGGTLPPDFHKAALKTLTNRWMKLDTLLGLIDRLGIGEQVLPLLAKVEYREGSRVLCQRLLIWKPLPGPLPANRHYPALARPGSGDHCPGSGGLVPGVWKTIPRRSNASPACTGVPHRPGPPSDPEEALRKE
jgi:hypothetical protein